MVETDKVTEITDIKIPKSNKIRKSIGETAFDLFDYTFLTIFAMITLLPFWNVLVISFTSYEQYAKSKLLLFPKGFTVGAYYIIGNPKIYISFLLTAFIVVVTVFLHLLFTAVTAYPLSKKYLKGRTAMLVYVLITMLFGGGLIPYYILIRNMHLIDNILVYIIPGLFSGFHMILVKNFFMQIPDSLDEAAKIDGANDLFILFRVYIPLSMPILSTIALFFAVGKWNDWFTAVLFVSNSKLYPIQNTLRAMVIEGNIDSFGKGMFQNDEYTLSVAIKMAVIAVATLPVICVYPFLQKHFVKGVMLGSIKA